MVGKVIATVDGREIVATLGDDGAWSCPDDPATETWLNACYDPRPGYSPSKGRFGVRVLNRAADVLDGRAEIGPRAPVPPGTVY